MTPGFTSQVVPKSLSQGCFWGHNLRLLVASVLSSESPKLSTSPEAKASRPSLPSSVTREELPCPPPRGSKGKEDMNNALHCHGAITYRTLTAHPALSTAIRRSKGRKYEKVMTTQISGEENQHWHGDEPSGNAQSVLHVLFHSLGYLLGNWGPEGCSNLLKLRVTCSNLGETRHLPAQSNSPNMGTSGTKEGTLVPHLTGPRQASLPWLSFLNHVLQPHLEKV